MKMSTRLTKYTSPALLICALFFSGQRAGAQSICGPIVENFNNTGGSTAGFTGDFSYEPTGQTLIRRNIIATANYSITTPTYQLPTNATGIGYGFTLDGAQQIGRAEVVIMYISTLTNEMTTIFLAQFVPNYGSVTSATPCRAVDLSDLPGFPAGGQYRFRIDLTSSSGSGLAAQTVTFDNFRTNGGIAPIPLPVSFISIEAKKINGPVQLTWKVAGEENVVRYEVEKSTDGRSFANIGMVACTGKDTYTFTDAGGGSLAFYRVRNQDKNGAYKFSAIVRISGDRSAVVLKAFPQPVATQLTLQHPATSGKALLSISTADGRVVRSVTPATGSLQSYVNMNGLQPGLYMLRFDAGDGNVETLKVVKQ